jgi:hypothetical protein
LSFSLPKPLPCPPLPFLVHFSVSPSFLVYLRATSSHCFLQLGLFLCAPKTQTGALTHPTVGTQPSSLGDRFVLG